MTATKPASSESTEVLTHQPVELKWYNFGRRHSQALLMFFGLVMSYALRTNLSVAIVAMTEDKQENKNFPVMDWSAGEKGLVLSSFFWGYMVLQIPAGLLAKRYGAKILLVITFTIQAVLTILTPVTATYGGWIATVVIRVCIGLAQGFVYPCVNTHMARWAVPSERSKLFAFAFSGSEIGAMIVLLIGGTLAANSTCGWPSIFYISGVACFVWTLACLLFAADSPDQHKTISQIEKDFINGALKFNKTDARNMTTPWLHFLKSLPLWGLALAHMGNCWGFMVLLTLIPSYISGALKFDLGNDGFLSALPYLAQWVFSVIFSIISDYLGGKKIISNNVSRKFWNSVAHYGGAAALLALAFCDASVPVAIVLLVLAVALNAGTFMGYLCNHLDLSPNFAGPLMGITNCLSNICSICGPLISSYILTDNGDKKEWQLVFTIASVIFIVGNTTFVIFGSTEVQYWNDIEEHRKKNKKDPQV